MSEQSSGGRRTGRAGIREVARLAGVSPITVSRALATPDRVSPETRSRVVEAVTAAGYIPNRVASSLSSNRTRLVAAVVPTLRNSIAADFIDGLSTVLHENNYQLLLGNTDFSKETEEQLVVEFLARRADAIYLTGSTHTDRTRSLIREAGLPAVEVATLPGDPIDMAVGISNEGAVYEMVKYLHRRGRRKIAFFSSLTTDNERQIERQNGYKRAIAELRLEASSNLIYEMTLDLANAARSLDRLLKTRPDVDALVCTSDILAIGALFECQRRDIPVPGKMAITGFEDLELAQHVRPALTTIQIPRFDIGARAAQMLLDRLAGKSIDRKVLDLGFKIIPRETA
jgi:LacI family gluconate utilization system Gnt-I transcriptional repressor